MLDNKCFSLYFVLLIKTTRGFAQNHTRFSLKPHEVFIKSTRGFLGKASIFFSTMDYVFRKNLN